MHFERQSWRVGYAWQGTKQLDSSPEQPQRTNSKEQVFCRYSTHQGKCIECCQELTDQFRGNLNVTESQRPSRQAACRTPSTLRDQEQTVSTIGPKSQNQPGFTHLGE